MKEVDAKVQLASEGMASKMFLDRSTLKFVPCCTIKGRCLSERIYGMHPVRSLRGRGEMPLRYEKPSVDRGAVIIIPKEQRHTVTIEKALMYQYPVHRYRSLSVRCPLAPERPSYRDA